MLKLFIKLKKSKLNLNIILTSILLFVSISSYAILKDKEQFIYIESDVQLLDMQDNIIIFSGNVVVKKGKMKISANKIIITRSNGESGKEIIDGYGNPVFFCQEQDDGTTVQGYASNFHYERATDFIVLADNAYFKQDNNSITGNKITYLIKKKIMQAYGKEGKRVTTVLMPFSSFKKH